MTDGAASPQPTPLDVGSVVGGNYRLTRLLGEGGMGKVFEAQHLRLPRRAAVKILQSSLNRADEILERFQREAEIAASLGNKHIVQVFDYGTLDDGSPFMIMEFLEGKDLFRRMQECGGRLTPPEIIGRMSQVVAGVEAAHQKGVVHRDLKPENLFIAKDTDGSDVMKIVDFGLSKMKNTGRALTGVNILGTPAYMSPEQIKSTTNADRRTDVYALGVILYQLITGTLPFQDENVMALLTKVMNDPAPSASIYAPWVSEELDRVLTRSMAKNADDRYSTANEFWSEARPALEASMDFGMEDIPSPSMILAPPPSARISGAVPTGNAVISKTHISGAGPGTARLSSTGGMGDQQPLGTSKTRISSPQTAPPAQRVSAPKLAGPPSQRVSGSQLAPPPSQHISAPQLPRPPSQRISGPQPGPISATFISSPNVQAHPSPSSGSPAQLAEVEQPAPYEPESNDEVELAVPPRSMKMVFMIAVGATALVGAGVLWLVHSSSSAAPAPATTTPSAAAAPAPAPPAPAPAPQAVTPPAVPAQATAPALNPPAEANAPKPSAPPVPVAKPATLVVSQPPLEAASPVKRSHKRESGRSKDKAGIIDIE